MKMRGGLALNRAFFLTAALFWGLSTLGASGLLYGMETPVSKLKVPSIFSDNMVLQRGLPVPVWGTAPSGGRVSVRFKGRQKTAEADAQGQWMVRLEALEASARPETLTVSGAAGQLVFTNVLVGEVWLCSGQSNMECSFGYLKRSDEVKGVNNPLLRLTSGSGWNICTADSLQAFSCVGYYFGLKVWKELHVPVGLINISQGCSSIEAWMTPESLKANGSLIDRNGVCLFEEMKKFRQFAADYDRCDASEKERVFREHCESQYSFARGYLGKDGKPKRENYKDILWHMGTVKPAHQYSARIAPVAPFAMKGVIWYQGETNVGEPQYALKQQILIASWRDLWKEGDFPFYSVQIAPYKGYPKLPEFWLEQYEAARKIPRTGLVSTVDISDIEDCHPLNKRDVGLRLALLALRDAYGKKDLVASGPTYRAATVEGDKITVAFDSIGEGLTTRDGQSPNWFEIAGADGKFMKAVAELRDNRVVVHSPAANPVYVRYAWHCRAEPNLCNKEGLPAFPFNTAEPFFQRHE